MTNPAAAKAAPASGVNLRQLLEEMIERDASDLHITAGERPKLRIDGEITNSNSENVLTPKAAPASNYSFTLANTIPAADHTTYVLEMTSQAWLTTNEVDRPLGNIG